MRLSPQGKFFLRRPHRDDMTRGSNSPQALTELDVGFLIKQTAETIAVGIHFARAMGCLTEETSLAFAFKWTKLKNRKLSCWANHEKLWLSLGNLQNYSAHQDEFTKFVNIPLDTPLSALSNYVEQVVHPLFEVFNGFNVRKDIIEDMTRDLIERK